MGKRYRIILFLFFTANMVFAESNLDSLLVNLDQTILQHEIYKDRREARIRELKGKATKTAPNSIAAYQLNDSIYREYKSYMCDSAVLYLTKNIRIARNLRDQEREYKSKLLLASLHAATGMYQEASMYWRKSAVKICQLLLPVIITPVKNRYTGRSPVIPVIRKVYAAMKINLSSIGIL